MATERELVVKEALDSIDEVLAEVQKAIPHEWDEMHEGFSKAWHHAKKAVYSVGEDLLPQIKNDLAINEGKDIFYSVEMKWLKWCVKEIERLRNNG